MKITCISDLHGFKPELPGGDLLIVAGDLTAADSIKEHFIFLEWLEIQLYKNKVVIAGNHDGFIQRQQQLYKEECAERRIHYLQDSCCEINGLKVYGVPWTPPFLQWHFMANQTLMQKKVDEIPDDVDILVTHGPSHGTMDKVRDKLVDSRVGCSILNERLMQLKSLKLHVFGHIHEGYGQSVFTGSDYQSYICVNASIMTRDYEPTNNPITLEL